MYVIIRTLGYTNFKNRAMERQIDIVKNMGDHSNTKHHMSVNKSHHHDSDSPR